MFYRRIHRFHYFPLIDSALVLLTMVCYVVGYVFITVIPDTARDVGAAWRIVHAGDWPLLGPEIGQRWHLGPVWFYLLAPIVSMAGSLTQVMLAAGMLASLKFPLAYGLGMQYQGRSLGLIWMGVLAMPGWNSLEHVVFAHTNMVEVTTLSTLWFALKVSKGGGALSFICMGLMASLALHAHPTTLVLVAPVLAAAVFGARVFRFRVRLMRWVGCVAGFVLPFVPMLMHEAANGFSQWQATLNYAVGMNAGKGLGLALGSFLGFFAHAFPFIQQFLFASMPHIGWLVACAVSVVMVGGLVSLFWMASPAERRVHVILVFYVAFAILGVSVLREFISFYMLFALLPLTTGVVSLGWTTAIHRMSRKSGDALMLCLVVICIGTSVLALQARYELWREGWQTLPMTIVDVALAPAKHPVLVDFLPVFELDQLAHALCVHGHAALGGDAGAVMENAQGLPIWLHCSSSSQFDTGGAISWVGYPAELLRKAGSKHVSHAKGFVWARSEAHGSPSLATHSIQVHRTYPPHRNRGENDTEFKSTFITGDSDWVAVTALNRAFISVQEPVVVLNGVSLPPAARSANTWLYPVTQGATLSISVRTGDSRWIHVAMFGDAALHDEPMGAMAILAH